MKKISREELQRYLEEILDCGAFELHKKEERMYHLKNHYHLIKKEMNLL